MSLPSFIAYRYLRAGNRNRFFSWIALLSIVGIAIGVATMIVVLSVINGFERELRNRFLNANAHILAFKYPSGLRHVDRWIGNIQNDFGDEIIGISPFVHYETMIKKDSIMHSVLVRGFDPKVREKVQSLRTSVHPQNSLNKLQSEITAFKNTRRLPKIPAVVVGEGVLKIIGAKPGDTIQLISPKSKGFKGIKTFKVVGQYHSGLKHYDNRLIAMSLPVAKDFFQTRGRVTGLEIGLKNPFDSPEIASRMLSKYSLSVKEWQSFNRSLLEALNMERMVISLVVFLVAFVAGFNILTTLFVAVTQKQKEISILKALGASNSQIVQIFLRQGVIFGVLGALLGMILAVIISWAIETYEFIELPDPYYLTKLPVDYDWRIYLGFGVSGIIICVVAGLFPAFTAARIIPTEGLRGTGKATL